MGKASIFQTVCSNKSMNDIAIIYLRNGGMTTVDADLHSWLNQWKWSLSPEGYAFRSERVCIGKFRKVYLHALINGTPQGQRTDHINLCRLDNRRSNLRTANAFQSNANMGKHKRGKVTSSYKGVWRTKTGKWVSQIGANGKRHCLGTFSSETEAAKVWNEASKRLHGEFSRQNIIVTE